MSGRTLTSSLIVRLIDQVTAPARKITSSLLGLEKAASGGSFGKRLGAAIERNNQALDRARGRMLDAVAGVYALKTAFGTPWKKAADFETVLLDIAQKADLSDTAMKTLGNGIKGLSKDLGKSASSIATGIDDLMGKGLDAKSAQEAIAPITKVSTAYRAAVDEVASASFSVMDNMKVPAAQLGKALDIMSQAGKEGAFELRDMAKEFPALTARAQALGMAGTTGVARLSAMLQIARKGAGSSAEAATNAANLMQKIISPETTKKFKKAGIDIRKELKKTQKEGGDVFEMIARLTTKATKGDLSKIGDFFQDAQVQGALLPLIQNLKEYMRIRDEAANAKGVVDEDFARRQKTSAAAMERFNAGMERLAITVGTVLIPTLNDLLDTITPFADKLSDWVEKNPQLASGIMKATAAIVAFKVATTGLTYLGLLGRGGALAALSVAFNTLGRAVIGAARGARGMLALQGALAAMSGAKYSGLAKVIDALKGMALAVPGVSAIGTALSAVGSALATVSAPVWGGIAVAVALVAAAGALMWKYWDRITSVVRGVASAIGTELAPVIERVKPILDALAPIGNAIATGWQKAKEVVSEFATWIGSFFSREVLSEDQKAQWEAAGRDAATRMIEAIKAVFAEIVAWAKNIGSQIGNAIADGAIAAVGKIKGMLGSAVSFVTGGGGSAPADGGAPAAPAKPFTTGTKGSHRATGGPVWPGSSFLVGERGEPEIFTPKTGGTITPVSKAGGPAVHAPVTININGFSGDAKALAREIETRLGDKLGRSLRGAYADHGAAWS